ncbi:NB-ARC domains-containing protein [Tanacetum coccineum]
MCLTCVPPIGSHTFSRDRASPTHIIQHCCNLTTTPDFSKIRNLEELNLEGCVNLVTFHPSIGMLKRLVVLNLTGCLKVNQLPEALGQIKSLRELHADRTAITEVPSFVSSLINLESLSFGGQRRIQPRWWTSITAPFGLLIQVPESIGGLSCLKKLNLEGNNILEVRESIGFLSCLKYLYLGGNNFTTLPGSLSQLSSLEWLDVDGCKKLEVLAKLPPSLREINASDCTSLREVMGSSKDQFRSRFNNFGNCPKLFKNDTIDIEGSISKIQCPGSIHEHYALFGFGYVGIRDLDILYHGNRTPEWFTNRSRENHIKVELPSEDWCYDKLRGFATCVVFKYKKPSNIKDALETRKWRWKEAKNFVTFSFFEENNEDVEVKECGVRLICDENIQQEAHLSMLQCLPTPTQHGGFLSLLHGLYNTSLSW